LQQLTCAGLGRPRKTNSACQCVQCDHGQIASYTSTCCIDVKERYRNIKEESTGCCPINTAFFFCCIANPCVHIGRAGCT
jgi:hypothetical protein